MTSTIQDTLITTLQQRFEKHPRRHEGIAWTDVHARIMAKPAALQTLQRMEDSGGEPDVVSRDQKTGAVTFFDCSPESPAGRRSLCYDRAALEARKANKPAGNVMDVAASIGIEILTEEQYRMLQTLGEFDLKTSSWILTPSAIRTRGGALFCDRRFDHVFTYHNGAESYYAARGFRGCLRV